MPEVQHLRAAFRAFAEGPNPDPAGAALAYQEVGMSVFGQCLGYVLCARQHRARRDGGTPFGDPPALDIFLAPGSQGGWYSSDM
ncbi:hypothetical protein LTR10_011114 [Elasticomyces elasticus]|nr:hypothetical protein LTR10_011114 [Elasticomyces elasticus]